MDSTIEFPEYVSFFLSFSIHEQNAVTYLSRTDRRFTLALLS